MAKNNVKEKTTAIGMLFDMVSVIASAVVAVGVCFVFLFRTIQISGDSMLPTLKNGEQVILQSVYGEPVKGDIVVTCQPNNSLAIEDVLVKRIIAVGGQTVALALNESGQYFDVYVDGIKQEEDFINEKTVRLLDFREPVTVPEGHVFVMGDNRNASTDSRDERVGFIRNEYIMGKVRFEAGTFKKIN